MNLNEYQELSARTAQPHKNELSNYGLGLAGESGEVVELIKKSQFHGHNIHAEEIAKEWVYSDTKEPTAGNERNCGFCGLENTPEGHDGCLGTLPGIMNACCGHGYDKAYVQFENGLIIRGRFD